MELEAGMYVRIDGRKSSSTKYQKFFMIDRIKYIDNCKSKYKYLIKEDKDGYCYTVSDEMIVKASHNIIDLIEVGDYVNGSKVVNVSILTNEKWIWVEETEDSNNKYGDDYVGYNNEQIKSIVTKEMFEQMEYKVVE